MSRTTPARMPCLPTVAARAGMDDRQGLGRGTASDIRWRLMAPADDGCRRTPSPMGRAGLSRTHLLHQLKESLKPMTAQPNESTPEAAGSPRQISNLGRLSSRSTRVP